MTPGARIQAAIDILESLENGRRPADEAIKAWGRAHRFAGSKDRAAIRHIVMTSFRHKGEAADMMGADDPRAVILGSLRLGLGWSGEDISTALGQGKYDAAALSDEERGRLACTEKTDTSNNWPDWLAEKIRTQFHEVADAAMAALNETAPLDLRVNPSRTDRETMRAALASVGFSVSITPLSPIGLRIERKEGLGGANIRALPIFQNGLVEIQDEGSQLVAALTGAEPGMTVVDMCAGGGGKTLVLGAAMEGQGRLIACDVEDTRLRAGRERERRAGLASIEHILLTDWDPSIGDADPELEELAGSADLVVLDVPCSGSGAWRRQPEAKWRLSQADLQDLTGRQARILKRGARLVKPGGRLVYITCSVFEEENSDQVERVMSDARFEYHDVASAFHDLTGREISRSGVGIQLAPHITNTDGFFIAMLERKL